MFTRTVSFVTLCQISDVHLAASPETGAGSADDGLGHAMELVAAEAPDGLVLTGDIADDGSVAACARVRSIVESLGVPILATPGNHDRPEVVRQVFGDVDEIGLGAWRILGVDTTLPGQDGGRIDVDAVAETLGADAGTPTVLAMHHPPLTTSTSGAFRLDGAAELIGMLSARSDVRVVLSGHLHEAFAVVLGAVNFLGCSSTYYGIEHGSDEPRLGVGHVGALRLRLHDDGTCDWRRLPDPATGAYVDNDASTDPGRSRPAPGWRSSSSRA